MGHSINGTFSIIYTLLGGLGIFFYGMKIMGDSLQSAAGELIRRIINALTTNRILAVLVGTAVTMIVQSSSVTTVMVVGLVNASLMNLVQAIGVIMGANIGTTITGWIISIKVGKYGLLLVALGIFPALFAKNNRWKQVGMTIFGVGLIFVGLELMSAALKPLRGEQAFLDAIAYFNGNHYGSYLASMAMGMLFTMIIQSSSAMLGITIAMATTGVVEFHTAVALVFGSNIGTTITAILACVGGNTNAKRAAFAHAIFNIIGVLVIMIFFPIYIKFIDSIIPGDVYQLDAQGSYAYAATHIATAHTIFNVVATILFLPFVTHLAKLVTWLLPGTSKRNRHLVHLNAASGSLPATDIVQAFEETKKQKDVLTRMYKLVREYLESSHPSHDMFAKIKHYEGVTDNIQKEINLFLGTTMEKTLSHKQAIQVQCLIRLSDELESIGDYLEKLANYKTRSNEILDLSGELGKEFFEFGDAIWQYFENTARGLVDADWHDRSVSQDKSQKLKIWADSIRDRCIERISNKTLDPLTNMTYSDMIVALRKVKSHSVNIAQEISKLKEIPLV